MYRYLVPHCLGNLNFMSEKASNKTTTARQARSKWVVKRPNYCRKKLIYDILIQYPLNNTSEIMQ